MSVIQNDNYVESTFFLFFFGYADKNYVYQHLK